MISPSELSRTTRPRKIASAALVLLFWTLAVIICITLVPRDTFPQVPPAPPMPSPNAAADFHNAALLLQKNGGAKMIASGQNAPSLPQLRAAVQANQKALAEFRRALAMPCQYPMSRHITDPVSLHLEEVTLGQFVVQEGKIYEADRNWRAAADSYLDIYEFGIKMAAHSSLLNGLTGNLLQTIATEPLGSLLDRCDPATAAHISDRLTPLYFLRRPSFDLIQEQWFAELCHLRDPLPTGSWRERYNKMMYCQILHIQQKNWEAQIAWAKKPPYLRGQHPGSQSQGTDLVSCLLWKKIDALNMPLLYQSGVQDSDKKQVETQLVLAKANLIAYHGQHNAYPTTLAALSLSPELITDPYSNRSLVYAPPTASHDRTIKLYSVGLNQTDDGGSKDDILPGSPQGR